MARTVRDTNLESRAARSRLKARKKPYWRSIERGAHLGYYKGKRGGAWCARWYAGNGRYVETNLATTDDTMDPDGVAVLGFAEAQAEARQWFAEQARAAAGLGPKPRGPYTVTNAMADYLEHYRRRARAVRHTQSAIDTHIVPALGNLEVARLTPEHLRKWLHGLDDAPALLRSRKGAVRNVRAAEDADAKRRRKATANRILTVLKAALNHAWNEGRAPSDAAWRKVKPYRDVESPVVRYLTAAECKRLVNACPPDFRQLVRAALLTGCRYGELLALRAGDLDPDVGTLTISTSKSGKARHVVLTDEGRRFFSIATAGRASTAPTFAKADGGAWKPSHQRRPLIEACKHAKISPAVSFHVLRHTHASLLAMHGVPLAVIAEQLGHGDTRMTVRHYAHLAPSYVAKTIRQHFPRLGIVDRESKIAALVPRSIL